RRGLGGDVRGLDDARIGLAGPARPPARGACQGGGLRPGGARPGPPRPPRGRPRTGRGRPAGRAVPWARSGDEGASTPRGAARAFPHGLDGARGAIFEDFAEPDGGPRRPAAELIRRLERDVMANVYRWSGHFPERTRVLLRHLAEKAQRLGLGYPADREGP